MIVSYSVREGSLVTGLSQTFDVEHPCALCVAVAFGMKQEKNDPKQQEETSKKLLLVLTLSARPVLTPPPFVIFKTEVTHTAVEQFAKCCSQLETAHEL